MMNEFTKGKDLNELESAERRNFLRLTGAGAFTAAMVGNGLRPTRRKPS